MPGTSRKQHNTPRRPATAPPHSIHASAQRACIEPAYGYAGFARGAWSSSLPVPHEARLSRIGNTACVDDYGPTPAAGRQLLARPCCAPCPCSTPNSMLAHFIHAALLTIVSCASTLLAYNYFLLPHFFHSLSPPTLIAYTYFLHFVSFRYESPLDA